MSITTTAPKPKSIRKRRITPSAVRAATVAAIAAVNSAPKPTRQLQRHSEDNKKIAAAEAVAREITLAMADAPAEHHIPTSPLAVALRSLTSAGWRHLIYHQDVEMTWGGQIRASSTGSLLFGFVPAADDRHSFIVERGVHLVEIPHDNLDQVLPGFTDWFAVKFGTTPQVLLEQARMNVDAAAINRAMNKLDDEEAPLAMEQIVDNWGAWA